MKTWRILASVLLVAAMVLAVAACVAKPAPAPEAVQSQANVPCYFGLGGTRFVAGRGCTINAQSGGSLQVDSGADFTVGGAATISGALTLQGNTQSGAVVGFAADAINGTVITHGLSGAPTYPACMIYTPMFITVTAYLSASNATSATIAMFDAAGLPYTGAPLPVRCMAIYVP